MNKKNFYKLALSMAALIMASTVSLKAQVTIGDDVLPKKGAILDLKKTNPTGYIGGLLLPHVEILDLEYIPVTYTEANKMAGYNATNGVDVNEDLAGMVVFCPTAKEDANVEVGFYLWDGKKWNLVGKQDSGMTINPKTPPTVCAEDDGNGCLTTEEIDVLDPDCKMGGNYSYTIVAGGDYASVSPESSLDKSFKVTFQPNNTALERKAIVLVTNPCGNNATFVFTQAGASCPSTLHDNPVLNTTTGKICQGGMFYLWVTNPQEGANYLWTKNKVVVNTGIDFRTSEPGVYEVYADVVGCGTAATATLTADKNNSSESPATITVSNNGVSCSGSPVTLTAHNVPSGATVRWFKDGVEKGTGNTFNTNEIGVWFAVIGTESTCSSTPSNEVVITVNESTTLATPTFTINGEEPGIAPYCKGGLLELKVTTNYSSTPGVTYQWYVDGNPTGSPSTSPIHYVVPGSADKLAISVEVSKSGYCSASATSDAKEVEFTAPAETSINQGKRTFICGNSPATLRADVEGASEYHWFRVIDGVDTRIDGATTNPYITTAEGKYKVAYMNGDGCVSKLSSAIEVVRSNAIFMSWQNLPTEDPVVNQVLTLSVTATPTPDKITWSTEPSSVVYQLSNPSQANITFPSQAGTFKVTATAENGCGEVSISHDFNVVAACTPPTSVNITPDGDFTIKEGETKILTAGSNGIADDLAYTWYVNDIQKATGETFSFNSTTLGDHYIKVVASGCSGSVYKEIKGKVEPNPTSYTEDATYTITGTNCFDVKMTNYTGNDCGAWDTRKNTFESGFSFKYELVKDPNCDPGSLIFTVNDYAMIEKVETNGNIGTVTFKNDSDPNGVRKQAEGTTNDDAKKVTVYALYTIGGSPKKVSLELTIKDCVCGCPVQVSASSYITMKCHNLGADESLDWSIPQKGLNGSYYQWGKTAAVATVDTGAAAISGWTVSPSYGKNHATWTASQADPCTSTYGSGWRLPTNAEWTGIRENNTWGNVAGSSWTSKATNFTSGKTLTPKKGGSVAAYLPAAGVRHYTNGRLDYRGESGYYWSSTQNSTSNGYDVVFDSSRVYRHSNTRSFGLSVRCVSE